MKLHFILVGTSLYVITKLRLFLIPFETMFFRYLLFYSFTAAALSSFEQCPSGPSQRITPFATVSACGRRHAKLKK